MRDILNSSELEAAVRQGLAVLAVTEGELCMLLDGLKAQPAPPVDPAAPMIEALQEIRKQMQ